MIEIRESYIGGAVSQKREKRRFKDYVHSGEPCRSTCPKKCVPEKRNPKFSHFLLRTYSDYVKSALSNGESPKSPISTILEMKEHTLHIFSQLCHL